MYGYNQEGSTMNRIGIIREFKTAHFKVIVEASEENYLDLSWYEDSYVAAGLNSGEFIAFTAHAYVEHDALGELSEDYLGGCIYRSLEDFADHKECGRQNREYAAKGIDGRCGSYFKDMIKNVCTGARKRIAELNKTKVYVRD